MPTVHPLKIELCKRGLTQRSFAPQVGVSVGTLGQVLNGRVAAWPALRRRIAEALDVPEAQLFAEPGVITITELQERARRLIERRVEQGLPPYIEDPDVLADVAAALIWPVRGVVGEAATG
jgi:transcriptional regulator with XRE-family HTH domain